MSRPVNPQIRQKLLERAIDYVSVHGLLDLSLRPLARELGTNARMLIYHFGSREGLMREILISLRKRGDELIQAWLRSAPKRRTIADFLRWYWRTMSPSDARPMALLIFELYVLALRYPEEYPGVLEVPLAYWKQLVEETGVSKAETETTATLLLAATRGLLLDLAATGEHARVRRALELLIRMMKPAASRTR